MFFKFQTAKPGSLTSHGLQDTNYLSLAAWTNMVFKFQTDEPGGLNLHGLQPLQKIQNFAARLVLLAPRHHHATPLLEKLHWLPISERIKYKVVCMSFSAINGCGPAYLSELLHVYTPSRTLRSSSDTRMLEIQQYKRKTHGFRTFSCFGPHIWNSLPQDLRHCATLSSFKAKLKTFLFSQYFHPN